MTAEWDDPTVGIEIIGDNLVLILSFERLPDDQIFIYEWKTGVLKTVRQIQYHYHLLLDSEIFTLLICLELPSTTRELLGHFIPHRTPHAAPKQA